MHVGSIQSSWSAIMSSRKIVGLFYFSKVFQLAKLLQAVVDELPAAVDGFGVDFTFAVNGTATRAIHQTLGTTGNRADASEFTELAVATGQTNFQPFALLLDQADELGIDPRVDALVWEDVS